MEHIHLASSEVHEQQTVVDTLTELREGRWANAERAAVNQLRNTMHNLDRTTSRPVSLMEVSTTSLGYDCGRLSAAELLAFEAVGLESGHLLEQTGADGVGNDEEFATLHMANETLHVSRYNQGVTLRLTIDDPAHKPDVSYRSTAMTERIKKSFAASAPYRSIMAARETIEAAQEMSPLTVAIEPFSPTESPLATLAFLEDTGLVLAHGAIAARLRKTPDSAAVITELLPDASTELIAVEKIDEGTLYRWGKGVERQLFVDAATGSFALTLTARPEYYYAERANQMADAEAVPFIETDCAREVCAWMDEHGLMFAPQLQKEMMQITEADRYGAVYTQISRHIAKWVDDSPEGRVLSLFVPYDETLSAQHISGDSEAIRNYMYADSIDPSVEAAREQQVIDTLAAVDTSRFGEAAATILRLAQESITRQTHESDLPVTKQSISISSGACFDVAAYYLGAAGMVADSYDTTALRRVSIDGVEMLEKRHGSHSFLLTHPITFNGVRLPKGSLMTQADDEGWAFQRLTPFTFDDPRDQQATGSELAKAYVNQLEDIRRIGGWTLKHLIAAVR